MVRKNKTKIQTIHRESILSVEIRYYKFIRIFDDKKIE